MHESQKCGSSGGTIFLAEGIEQSKLLEILGLNETLKEILTLATTEETCSDLQERLNETFMFDKKKNGVAFSIPFVRWELKTSENNQTTIPRKMNASYFCIMTIVDKGRGKECLKIAKASGAKEGVVIRGHGAGVPTDFYYPLVIEPQKDIALIIAARDKVAQIRDRIFTDLELEKEGKGIIFVLPINKISGLKENNADKNVGGI